MGRHSSAGTASSRRWPAPRHQPYPTRRGETALPRHEIRAAAGQGRSSRHGQGAAPRVLLGVVAPARRPGPPAGGLGHAHERSESRDSIDRTDDSNRTLWPAWWRGAELSVLAVVSRSHPSRREPRVAPWSRRPKRRKRRGDRSSLSSRAPAATGRPRAPARDQGRAGVTRCPGRQRRSSTCLTRLAVSVLRRVVHDGEHEDAVTV